MTVYITGGTITSIVVDGRNTGMAFYAYCRDLGERAPAPLFRLFDVFAE